MSESDPYKRYSQLMIPKEDSALLGRNSFFVLYGGPLAVIVNKPLTRTQPVLSIVALTEPMLHLHW